MTSIGIQAFVNCYSLTKITIPENVTSIKSSAFERCESLTTVVIKSSNQLTFDSEVFWNCQKLTTIYFYSLIEPKYDTASDCIPCNGDVFATWNENCAPFNCNAQSMTIYVPIDYKSTSYFCGKYVTFKREL